MCVFVYMCVTYIIPKYGIMHIYISYTHTYIYTIYNMCICHIYGMHILPSTVKPHYITPV